MRRKKCNVFLLTLVISICICCTTAYAANIPKLNIDKNPVYARNKISNIINEANSNYAMTAAKYKDVDIIDVGKVKSIEKNQKSLSVDFGSDQPVIVKTNQKDDVSRLSEGSYVTVYGKLNFESEKKKTVSVKADHLVKKNDKLSFDYYIYGSKKAYSDSDSILMSLANNRIKYRIPKNWSETEPKNYDKIFNNKIYNNKTGKCYYMNLVSGEIEPEIFCIFYFDNNFFLEESGDKDKTADIEKEIINNICPEDTKNAKIWPFPTENSTSSTGVKYDHYVANYDNYRIEFVFTPIKGKDTNDNGGICVMMHMYNDDSIKPDDVLYVMNSLSVSG